MREVPKVNSTILNGKLLRRPAVMSLLCKNELNETMDNPQTVPKTDMIGYGICPNDYQQSG